MSHSPDDITRFARIEALLDAALEYPPEERDNFLQNACDDASLRSEVRELLHAIDASEGFLETTAPASTTTADEYTDQHIGPWRLVRRIGHGGMGDVWLGERSDNRFEQHVAVKLLRQHGSGDAARMLREQRLLARLQHPNIARLIDAGSLPDGAPYMVMEYIEGTPLLQYCQQHALSLEARLSLFIQVCDAVAFAHRHLIVHRDLKPDNILVRTDGQPLLLDFGIARLIDDSNNDSGNPTRELLLTPRYAAPEQLSGNAQSTLTDVYALGLLLHELLTGHSPWGELANAAPIALLQRAQAGPPPAPSSQANSAALARKLRGDLDAIVHKALRPEPAARYASAEALAEDIRRHLDNAPVSARGDALGYRTRRFLQRYWLPVSMTVAVFTGLLVALTAISLARQEALRERDAAQIEATRSKAVRDYLAHMLRDAAQHAGDGTPLTAKQVLDQAAARVQSSFADDPATDAEVLKALGELHFHLNDYTAAEPLLRQWLAHEHIIADPIAAAEVRSTLAGALYNMGNHQEAAQLLEQAQRFWLSAPERHAEALLSSRNLQARMQREQGNIEAALATLEAALLERLQRSGRHHFETASLYTNLGATYTHVGRLDEAIAAAQEAMQLWRELGLDTTNDALNTLNNLAAAQFRKGDYAQARLTFAEALNLRRTLYGPSAATAALIGNTARVLHQLGHYEEALAHASEATDMATTHTGPGSPLTQASRITRAELLLALKRPQEASATLADYDNNAQQTLPTPLRLRAALAQAESHHHLGHHHSARLHLQHARNLLPESGPEQDHYRQKIENLAAGMGNRKQKER